VGSISVLGGPFFFEPPKINLATIPVTATTTTPTTTGIIYTTDKPHNAPFALQQYRIFTLLRCQSIHKLSHIPEIYNSVITRSGMQHG